jgi:hypothetical protein
MAITINIVKTLQMGIKGGYKPHEIEGTNEFYKNVTEEFFKKNPPDEVDLKQYFDPREKYLWILAASDAQDRNGNPATLISLIVGKEHEFGEEVVKKKNEGADLSLQPAHTNVEREETGGAEQDIAKASPEIEVESSPLFDASDVTPAVKERKDNKKKDKGKAQEKKKLMGHPTLAHKGFIAGDLFYSEEEGGWIMNNKSGRYGDGNEQARKKQAVHKKDLLEFAADKLQIESNLDIVGLDLYHANTPAMYVMYKLEKFFKKRPMLDQITGHKVRKITKRPTREEVLTSPGLKKSIDEFGESAQAQFEVAHGSRITTLTNPVDIVSGSVGFFIGQGEDGSLYFQKAKQQQQPSFIKIPADLISDQAAIGAPTTSKALPSPTIALRIGQPLPQQFKNTLRDRNPGLFAERGKPRLKKQP